MIKAVRFSLLICVIIGASSIIAYTRPSLYVPVASRIRSCILFSPSQSISFPIYRALYLLDIPPSNRALCTRCYLYADSSYYLPLSLSLCLSLSLSLPRASLTLYPSPLIEHCANGATYMRIARSISLYLLAR